MLKHWRVISVVAVPSVLVSCAPAGGPPAAAVEETVLECSADDIRHVFHIRAAASEVDDTSVTPAKTGSAEVTGTEYRLLFQESRDHYELMVRIDRASGRGTRRLFDDEQQPVKGHGGTDDIICSAQGAAN